MEGFSVFASAAVEMGSASENGPGTFQSAVIRVLTSSRVNGSWPDLLSGSVGLPRPLVIALQ